MPHFDVIVIGAGGMGSAALWHLAGRGARVVALDRFGVAHDRGSSHGRTRLIRKAYFEHSDYVPLLHRAYELWRDLENAAGRRLYTRTGLLLFGPPEGDVIRGVRHAATAHALSIDDVPMSEVSRRFGPFHIPADDAVLFEPDAGTLAVEACISAQVELAVEHGASLVLGETVTGWSASDAGVTVTTASRAYTAGRLILCGGAWTASLLPELAPALSVRRKVVLWFPADAKRFSVKAGFPVFCGDTREGFFYGFPVIDADGLKCGEHSGGGPVADPADVDRELRVEDIAPTAAFLGKHLPEVSTTPTTHSVCLYTMSPDEHFVIDRHPEHPNVVVAAGFSGHGFKFASVVGSILADLALTGRTDEPIEFLRFDRLRSDAGAGR